MTNSPYTSGPADHGRPPQPGPAAHPGGPTAAPAGPAPLSFQYQPHDPRATFAPGQPAGPVLPPPPTFAQRWGFTGADGRPRQVTVILQSLWLGLAAAVLALVIGLAAASGAFSLAAGLALGLLAAAASLILIWAFARERLGRFGLQNPRHPVYIGLGILALNALVGLFSVWKFVPALVQLAAAALVLVLLFTRPARAWLRDRNQPRKEKEEERRPLPGEDYLAGQPQQQSPWPGTQPPPGGGYHAPGGNPPR
ncbi:hypothetical protein LO763_09415 [Glycomyces sp. A-F 0318]|uniref:hypothetical protein n=1 Tax=Glycomyces amatae TaxID=2881355 RepID=UPI001E35B9AD|nr:hypothetical protein [Glycomyces amatae]MCD0443841.1 hypothetical protein [Glycomyces amatae]